MSFERIKIKPGMWVNCPNKETYQAVKTLFNGLGFKDYKYHDGYQGPDFGYGSDEDGEFLSVYSGTTSGQEITLEQLAFNADAPEWATELRGHSSGWLVAYLESPKEGEAVRGEYVDAHLEAVLGFISSAEHKWLKNKLIAKLPSEQKENQMKKSDLKTGMRVKTRNGTTYIVMLDGSGAGDVMVRSGGFSRFDEYKSDLSSPVERPLDIVAVYDAPVPRLLLDETQLGRLLWKREEEPGAQKEVEVLEQLQREIAEKIERLRGGL